MRVSVNKKAIVLGTSAKSLINFRGELLKCFLSKGFSMTVASLKPDKESLCALNKLGVQYQIINLKRNGLNFIDDLRKVLNHSNFPKGVKKILFSPEFSTVNVSRIDFAGNWEKIRNYIFQDEKSGST